MTTTETDPEVAEISLGWSDQPLHLDCRTAGRERSISPANGSLHCPIFGITLFTIDQFIGGSVNSRGLVETISEQGVHSGRIAQTRLNFRLINANLRITATQAVTFVVANEKGHDLVLSRELAVRVSLLGDVYDAISCLFLHAG